MQWVQHITCCRLKVHCFYSTKFYYGETAVRQILALEIMVRIHLGKLAQLFSGHFGGAGKITPGL